MVWYRNFFSIGEFAGFVVVQPDPGKEGQGAFFIG